MPNKRADVVGRLGLWLLLLAGLLWSQSAAALDRAALDAAADRLAAKVSQAGGQLGLSVIDVKSGAPVVERGAGLPLNPASNMKVLTAWAALRALGPGHRYLTAMYGEHAGGRVPLLTLRGDGDPSLEVRHLYEMVARMKRAGIRRIGDIAVDQSHFDDNFVPPAFGQQPHEWKAFRANVAALSLAANTIMIEVRAATAGQPARVAVVPSGFVDVVGQVRTSQATSPEALKLSLRPKGKSGRLTLQLGGSVPESKRTVRIWRRVDDPRLLIGFAVRDVCMALGVAVDGRVMLRKAKGSAGGLLSAHRSNTLARLVHHLGKHSNNFYAEMVFKSLSVADSKPPASFSRSSARVAALLREAGLDPSPVTIKNGSGLFDANRLTARFTAKLLAQAQRDPVGGPELLAQLSIGGVDGTLRHRFARHAALRSIRAKSGTLAAVNALSGYVLSKPTGHTLSFSVMINGVNGKASAMRAHIDRFVSAVADQAIR